MFIQSARLIGGAAAVAVLCTAGIPAPALADTQSDAPKNIILMIGDGMGFNHVDSASLYEHGKSNWQIEGEPGGEITRQDGYGQTPSQVFENFDVQLSMSHHSMNSPVYSSDAAWGTWDWANQNPTDSAASGTALATGTKTFNGYLGVDQNLQPQQNVAEFAAERGKATGVVSSVPFGHATPAAWGAHVESRKANHEIAQQMIDGPVDVIMGAGHPLFDDDGQPRDAEWIWLTEEQYDGLSADDAQRAFVEDTAGFETIASGKDVPEKVFGLAPVAETLQFNRSSLAEAEPLVEAGRENGKPIEGDAPLPFETAMNDMVSLESMTNAALNVLGQDEDGFFTMIEGGAIDWAGHANATVGNIEEVTDFNNSVVAVHDWVNENSSWDETLLIVTADHETGYLNGATDDRTWTPLEGQAGQLPIDGWNSPEHTNHLVPFFAQGAGSETISNYIKGTDAVRGDYIDNTDVAKLAFDLWADEPVEEQPENDTEQPEEDADESAQEGTEDNDSEDAGEQDEDDEDQPEVAPVLDANTPNGGRGVLANTGFQVGLLAAVAAGLASIGGTAVWANRRRQKQAEDIVSSL